MSVLGKEGSKSLGLRVEGLGFGFWGLGFGGWGLGFRVYHDPHVIVLDQAALQQAPGKLTEAHSRGPLTSLVHRTPEKNTPRVVEAHQPSIHLAPELFDLARVQLCLPPQLDGVEAAQRRLREGHVRSVHRHHRRRRQVGGRADITLVQLPRPALNAHGSLDFSVCVCVRVCESTLLVDGLEHGILTCDTHTHTLSHTHSPSLTWMHMVGWKGSLVR